MDHKQKELMRSEADSEKPEKLRKDILHPFFLNGVCGRARSMKRGGALSTTKIMDGRVSTWETEICMCKQQGGPNSKGQ